MKSRGVIGLYSDPKHVIAYDDGEVRQEFSICFRAKIKGGETQTSDESKEVIWSTPTGIERLNTHPSIDLRIKHALANTASAFFS